jgi:hypothetical protein
MTSESEITQIVIEKLRQVGWNDADILIQPNLYFDERVYRPDIILLFNLYPIAIIEVKNDRINLPTATDQIMQYSLASNINNLFLMNSKEILEVDCSTRHVISRNSFPTPLELWKSLGNVETDPRVYPADNSESRTPTIFQAQAVSESIAAILKGQRLQIINMPLGTGVSFVETQIVWKLIKSGFFRRALILTESLSLLDQLKSRYKSFNEQVYSRGRRKELETLEELNFQVRLELTNNVLKSISQDTLNPEIYELIVIDNVASTGINKISKIADTFSHSQIIAFSPSTETDTELRNLFGEPIFQMSVKGIVKTQPVIPPAGFTSVKLGEIAEIQRGLAISRKTPEDSTKTNEIYLITARNILSDGTLSFDDITTVKTEISYVTEGNSKAIEKFLIEENDILLSAIGTNIKVAFVPKGFPPKFYFSSSVMRIRVKSEHTTSLDVYNFLRSELGQSSLRNNTRGAAQQFIASRDIAEMLVFLPKEEIPESDKEEIDELTVIKESIRKIAQEILPRLEEIQDEDQLTAAENVKIVAEMLRNITSDLMPASLEEEVLSSYPTPIALAYKRFKDSRFNVYEQVLRLRDLFEAVGFFIYNIYLADAFLNLDANLETSKYYIQNKGFREAYNDYSMAYRIAFVEAILEVAKTNKGKDLFVPELIETNFISYAKKLQGDFRNSLSHTATAAESRIKNIIDSYRPTVEDMLIGELVSILGLAAEKAINDGEEKIDLKLLNEISWINPSDRNKAQLI